MKTKRILSVIVAVMLIFNIVTINTFALSSGEKASFSLKADSLTVAPGDTISVVLSVDEIDTSSAVGADFDTVFAGVAYDSTKVDIEDENIKNASIFELALGLGSFMTACDGVTITTDYSGAAASDAFDEIMAYAYDTSDIDANGWNSAVSIQVLLSAAKPAGTDVVKMAFKVADDIAPGTNFTIGIPQGSNEAWLTGLDNDFEGYNVDNATLTFTVASAGPEVVALGTMARMADWTKAESTNTFDGGLIGQINNANLTFTNGECNEIESIEVYANGQKMGNAYQVYKVDDTTYQFRAVILNMDKTNNYSTDVEYEFRVTMKGEYADSGVLTATKTVSAETIFTTAYNAYKAANA